MNSFFRENVNSLFYIIKINFNANLYDFEVNNCSRNDFIEIICYFRILVVQ